MPRVLALVLRLGLRLGLRLPGVGLVLGLRLSLMLGLRLAIPRGHLPVLRLAHLLLILRRRWSAWVVLSNRGVAAAGTRIARLRRRR